MKKIIFLIVILGSILLANYGQAAMVHYIDESGKRIYINTDYAKIPDRYLDQVKDQLNMLEPSVENPTPAPEINPASQAAAAPTPKEPPKVEVFVGLDCKECQMLEFRLRSQKIKYYRYDVHMHPYGKEFYAQHGGGTLPLTRIGDRVIEGNDYKTIMTIIENATVKPQPAQP